MIGHLAKAVTRRRLPWWVVVLSFVSVPVLLVALLAAVAFGAVAAIAGATPAVTPVSSCSSTVTGTAPGLTAEQQANAKAIAGVALSRGLGRAGVLVGITTALAESSLINVGHGDAMGPSSIGLFQQMPSHGPLAVRTDPAGAAGIFYTELVALKPAWTTMSIPAAAQAVEQSEYDGHTNWPGRGVLPLGQNYADQLTRAQAITDSLMAGQPAGTVQPVAAAGCGPTGPPPTGLTQNPSQDPSTFGWVRASGIVPYSWQGHVVDGGVANGTQALWDGFLTALAPHIPGGITSLGGFVNRNNVNNPAAVSLHAYGLAIDINAPQNPNGSAGYGRTGLGVIPGQIAHDLAAQYCLEYGGDFTGTPDPMHGEVHCTPAQVAQFTTH